jgi:vacuolar-type H+-ATPase subunit H
VADKKFLSWVGFKGEEEADKPNLAAGSVALDRIRELESQLNDLRSRRDITSLSKEEFEILATETAMSIIRTAQQREAKAKSTLAQAESRGRKYLEAAEGDAAEIVSKAESEAEDLINSKKREGSQITSNAKREAERLVMSATTEVSEYRTWLAGVISEAERLYRIQTQSLDAAENAISQSRARLESAFNRLAELQKQVVSAIATDGTPTGDSKLAARVAQAQQNATNENQSKGATTKSPISKSSAKKLSKKSPKKAKSKAKKTTAKSR